MLSLLPRFFLTTSLSLSMINLQKTDTPSSNGRQEAEQARATGQRKEQALPPALSISRRRRRRPTPTGIDAPLARGPAPGSARGAAPAAQGRGPDPLEETILGATDEPGE